MATKSQQYDGRLYTQPEVDRLVREARPSYDDLQDIMADAIYGVPYNELSPGQDEKVDYYAGRIYELSKEEV